MPLTTFLVKKEFLLHRPMLIFHSTVSSVRTILVSLEKCAVTKCLWRGLGGGGGTFWLLNESLTFKGPAA
jgi:hypothetical protein